ncbi:MAG: T9SS type A sorting domain-containing protein [Ignavibacteria bacterium]|nr:T9SS type A sorting domain-containing protein [Ignavibacteria bacterium]
MPNVFPGDADTICTGTSITLGKPSTCGEKFVYSWAASPLLVHTDSKNPEAIFTPTSPGTYTLTLTVQDQDGGPQSKSTTGSVTIVAREIPHSIFIPTQSELCECTINGNQIIARGNLGKAPYSFVWTTGNVEVMREDNVDSSMFFITALNSTTMYRVQITDAFGCVGVDSTTVIVNPCPVVTVTSPQICECESVQLSAEVLGNTNDYFYKWTNLDGSAAMNFSDTTISNPIVTPKSTTQYQLIVTNKQTGCLTAIFPAIIVGKDISPTASFSIPSILSDPRNKKVDIPIIVNEFTQNLQCMPREVEFDVTYNENIFDPNPQLTQGTVPGISGTIVSNTTALHNGLSMRTITVRCNPMLQLKQGDVLMSLTGAALIGDPGFSDVTISNINWVCGSGISSPDTTKGLLTLDSLCLFPIGTKRLLTFNSTPSVVAMVPNPTTGVSHISLRRYDGEEVRMSIFSALGEEIYTTTWQQTKVIGEEIATYPVTLTQQSGVYHVVLRSTSGVSTEQLIIVQ